MQQYRYRIEHQPSQVTTFTPWHHKRWSAYIDLLKTTDLGIIRILNLGFPMRPAYDLELNGEPFGTATLEQWPASASKAHALEQQANMEECVR